MKLELADDTQSQAEHFLYIGPQGLAMGKGQKTCLPSRYSETGLLSSLDMSPPVRHLRTPITLTPTAM